MWAALGANQINWHLDVWDILTSLGIVSSRGRWAIVAS